jgi:anaerobic selenocysteine-containing dehydrogenase
MSDTRMIDRRSFLKGSALLAAATGLGAAIPARAEGSPAPGSSARQNQTPAPSGEKQPEESKEVPAEKKPDEKKSALVDKNGREYRVCDMCGGNMYVEEKRWTCDQCGFSYEV